MLISLIYKWTQALFSYRNLLSLSLSLSLSISINIYVYTHMYIYMYLCLFVLLFYGISTFLGYLMPNKSF